jgi:hypothetical protein
MYLEARLVFVSVIADKLEKGMWFKRHIKQKVYKTLYEYDELFELKHIPQDVDSYIQINGYPVAPYIMEITDNPDSRTAKILATPEQIGWWDEGDHTEDLRDVTMEDFNYILSDEGGILQIEIDENYLSNNIIEPIIFMDKVTLAVNQEEYEYEEDDEEPWDEDDFDRPE